MQNIDKIINLLKSQAEAFLIDANEFYPFGGYIDKDGKLTPVGAYTGDEQPRAQELIDLLTKDFVQGINEKSYKIAAIALDISIKENKKTFDGILMRFFELNNTYEKKFRYEIKDKHVIYTEMNN